MFNSLLNVVGSVARIVITPIEVVAKVVEGPVMAVADVVESIGDNIKAGL